MLANVVSKTAKIALMHQTCHHLPKLCATILSMQPIRVLSVSNDDEEDLSTNYTDIPNKEPYREPPPEPWMSVWGEPPPCCPEECTNYRHDILYLKEKPKQYVRTWTECVPVKHKKRICADILEPEYEIRPRPKRPRPCSGNQYAIDLMTCVPPPKLSEPCARIRLPHCALPNLPPACKKTVIVKCCQKRCTMYPSYSECNMPKPKVKKPIECTCNVVPATCDIFAAYRKFPLK